MLFFLGDLILSGGGGGEKAKYFQMSSLEKNTGKIFARGALLPVWLSISIIIIFHP